MMRVYLGGSFNPPHFGHLTMAQTVAEKTAAITHLMPSHNPFKDKTDNTRLELLSLAIDEFNYEKHTTLAIEKIEILSESYPTYTLDTLQALKSQYPDDTLIFVIGQDSFNNLPKWKGGFELLNYCHLWVFGRGRTVSQTKSCSLDELFGAQNGKLYWDTTPILDISSTHIRNTIKELWQNQATLDNFYQTLGAFLPKSVISTIFVRHLYQI